MTSLEYKMKSEATQFIYRILDKEKVWELGWEIKRGV